MPINLTPQILDIIITKITPKTVWYDLYRSGQSEKWKIPAGSKFNTATLVIGQRYRVESIVVVVPMRDRMTRKLVYRQRYDWATAAILLPKAKLVAQTAKQRKTREAQDARPLVDTEGLFSF